VFEACYELRDAFKLLFERPDKLVLMTGELWPSARVLADEPADAQETMPGQAVMESVEHIGQYVYQMTTEKVAQLRVDQGLPEEDLAMAPIEDAEQDMGPIPEEDQESLEEETQGQTFEAEEDP
jgi:intron-binding protein aquarius